MPATTSTPRPARPPGRPRLPAGERLSEKVTVRFTPAMFAVLAARARQACLPLAEYLRVRGLQEPLNRRVPRVNHQCVHQLLRVGNNLNQLVKLLHQHRAPVGLRPTLRRLLALLEEIHRLLTAGGAVAEEGREEP